MLPNYLIVGATRCGTTWLGKNLMLHPDVFMPERKEIHFFNRYYDKGILWYEDVFKGATHTAIGEATPGYLYREHVPQLIKQHLPEVKLIFCLRDPSDRAYSHYWYREHERRSENLSMTFEEKIAHTPRLIEEGLYSKKLSPYLDLFPKENILVLLYDDLKADPNQYLQDTFYFLGVDKSFKSPLIDKQLNTSASKIGKTRVLFLLYRILNKLGIYNLASSIDQINRKNDIPPMNNDTRKMLLDNYYLEEIETLEHMIKRDLSAWKQY